MSSICPLSIAEIRHKRRDLAPNHLAAFEAFSNAVFAEGRLTAKIKRHCGRSGPRNAVSLLH